MLFWKDLTTFLTSNLGFSVNLYDWCVVNKDLDGSQCTIGWHVDNLKISQKNMAMVENIVEALNNKYGYETPPGCASWANPRIYQDDHILHNSGEGGADND